MPTATVTSKGQITIPKSIREALGVQTGDRVEFREEGERIVVEAATSDLFALEGYLGEPPVRLSVEEMAETVREAVARHARSAR